MNLLAKCAFDMDSQAIYNWYVNKENTMPKRSTPVDFWAKVTKRKGACWVWKGALTRDGYGQVMYHGRGRGAHRLAWELTNGPVPDGKYVLHHCDNPPCINPEHLWVGTQKDNMLDCATKDRTGRGGWAHGNRKTKNGIRRGGVKLSKDDIFKIREMLASGKFSLAQIGKKFDTVQSHIYQIKTGKCWGWLK